MPVYEYVCRRCNYDFEMIQPFGAIPPRCPRCEGKVRRVIHSNPVVFKGSGFYVTDKNEPKGPNSQK